MSVRERVTQEEEKRNVTTKTPSFNSVQDIDVPLFTTVVGLSRVFS